MAYTNEELRIANLRQQIIAKRMSIESYEHMMQEKIGSIEEEITRLQAEIEAMEQPTSFP